MTGAEIHFIFDKSGAHLRMPLDGDVHQQAKLFALVFKTGDLTNESFLPFQMARTQEEWEALHELQSDLIDLYRRVYEAKGGETTRVGQRDFLHMGTLDLPEDGTANQSLVPTAVELVRLGSHADRGIVLPVCSTQVIMPVGTRISLGMTKLLDARIASGADLGIILPYAEHTFPKST